MAHGLSYPSHIGNSVDLNLHLLVGLLNRTDKHDPIAGCHVHFGARTIRESERQSSDSRRRHTDEGRNVSVLTVVLFENNLLGVEPADLFGLPVGYVHWFHGTSSTPQHVPFISIASAHH